MSSLKDVGIAIAKYAPALGGLIGGPAGAGVGTAVSMVAKALGLKEDAKPNDILVAIQKDPAAGVKLAEIESAERVRIAEEMTKRIMAEEESEARIIDSVNGTIRADAVGTGWLQRNHHAIESLTTVAMTVGIYFILPLLHIPVPVVPEFAFMMLGAILGVTAWKRGQARIDAVKSVEAE